MIKKLKSKLRGRYVKVGLSILILIAVILAGKSLFFTQQAPSLREVLAHSPTGGAHDLPLIIASLLAFSFAMLSAAKGYEIFKRNKSFTPAVLSKEAINPFKTTGGYGVSRLKNKEFDELKDLRLENHRLKNQPGEIRSELDELKEIAHALRKSNISLGKDCERLKNDNEMLILKNSSLKIKSRQANRKKTSKTKKKIKVKKVKRKSKK